MESFLGTVWFVLLVCSISFVAGMALKDTVMSWIKRG